MKLAIWRTLPALLILAAAQFSRADTITVTTSASSGSGSLSDALNGLPYGSSNTIAFNIPGAGVHTIVVPSQLYVQNNTIIDGYTQAGSQPNTLTNGDNAVLTVELRAGGGFPASAFNLGTGCTVRGLVINGFTVEGIEASGGDVIQGNFLGTDPTGTVAEGNEYYGVAVTIYGSAGNVVIGGTNAAERNVISGNHFGGVELTGTSGAAVIEGNIIGADVTGTRPLGNGICGVVNFATGVSMVVGGTNVGAANVIAFNGVGVWNYPAAGGTVLENSIFGNDGLGISVGGLGGGATVLPNAPGGFSPIITSVSASGGSTKINGTLQGETNATYRVEFFANGGLDAIGFGQGQTYIGFKSVTTGSSGSASFSATMAGTYGFISATATDASGNTSEFSPDYEASTGKFAAGDLLLSMNDGLVQWRHSDGTLVGILNPGFGWNIPLGGSAFDANGNFYVTGQSDSAVGRFNSAGQSLGIFATNQYGTSSDIAFDAAGNAYVASQFSYAQIGKYDADGNLLANIDPDPQLDGLDRVQVAPDQRTLYFDGLIYLIISLYYTPFVERYDLATEALLPALYETSANINAPSIYGFRLLADGGALIASDNGIFRLKTDPAQPLSVAKVAQAYNAPGETTWDPLALNSDGSSFWAGSYTDQFIYRFDIGTGEILQRIDTGVTGGVGSIAVYGGPVASTTGLFLGVGPLTKTAVAGGSITNTLTLLNFHTNTLTGGSVVDTLPAGTTFVSAATSLGSFTTGGGKVTFTLGSIPTATNVTMTVVFKGTAAGVLTNSAKASVTGPVAENYIGTATATVLAAPGSMVVTSASDSGAGSLRLAMVAANAAGGTGVITFNISGSGPHVIHPLSPLPMLTAPVVIDGYSESGATQNSSSGADNATIEIGIDGASAGQLADGLTLSGGNSLVRGLAVYGFSGNGIALNGGVGTSIIGNFIGTDATGTGASGANGKNGILINGSLDNAIGGPSQAERNLISANGGSGIGITGNNTGNTTIQGNFIGVSRSGAALGNALDGALISASGNLIGGTNAGDGNVIDFNGEAGVSVFGTTSYNSYSTSVAQFTANVGILENSIFGNAQLGIDMAPAGVTFPNSQASGPDGGLGLPALNPITPGSTTVTGTLTSASSETFSIELFGNTAADVSGYGQGQTYLGAGTVVTDTNGFATFSIPVAALTNGEYLTATAVEAGSLNTSEFSSAVQVAPAANLAVTIAASANPATARQNLTFTITVTNQGPGAATGILLTNVTPAYTSLVTVDGGGTSAFSTPTKIFWSLGSLAAGASTNVHVTLTPTRVGSDTTTANVTALEVNQNPAETRASLTVLVAGTARTLTVATAADSGTGSLRDAINDVNQNGYGMDTINFAIPGTGVQTIELMSGLPSIIEPVSINGYSQSGAHPNTLAKGDNAVLLIQLQETNYPYGAILSLGAGNSSISGLVINGTVSEGIAVSMPFNSPPQQSINITGNFIGVSPAGTAAATNALDAGIYVSGNSTFIGMQIGGSSPAARNVISGNGGTQESSISAGISLSDANGVTIQGNYIGTDASGESPLGNSGDGIALYEEDTSVTIGGTAAGEGNIIAYNTTIGVQIGDGTNNAVEGNSIFGNGGMGIHLGFVYPYESGAPTPNHMGGPVGGPNNLQNYPVLTSVIESGGQTTVTGTLNSAPNTTYRVEFFANAQISESFYGQGQTYLGNKSMTTDGGGNASFSFMVSGAAENVTATATDPDGNTSEFSADLLPEPGAFQAGDLLVGSEGGTIQWRRHDGTPVALLNAGVTNSIETLAFGPAGQLVAATDNELIAFDNSGNRLGVLATNVSARSIVFDSSGNFYTAGGGYSFAGNGPIWKFSPSGNLLKTYTVAIDSQSENPTYLDLAADEQTLYYTSFGTSVERYDEATSAQLANLTSSLSSEGVYDSYDLRLLSDGSVLVASGQTSVYRLNASGNLLQTYTAAPASEDLSVLALDPDGASFWVSSYYSPATLYRFNLATGVLLTQMPMFLPGGDGGSPAQGSFAIYGEPRAAAKLLPLLSVARNGTSVVVSWPSSAAGFTLQQTTNLSKAWSDMPTATTSATVSATHGDQFFRLIKR